MNAKEKAGVMGSFRELRRLGVPIKSLLGMVPILWNAYREFRKMTPEKLQQLRDEMEGLIPERLISNTGTLRCKTCGKCEVLTESSVRGYGKAWPPCCGAPMHYVLNSELAAAQS